MGSGPPRFTGSSATICNYTRDREVIGKTDWRCETLKSRHFFDSAAQTWDSRPGTDKAKNAVEAALCALELREGDIVLDIGCGTGVAIPEIAKAVGAGGKVIGLDFSHGMLVQAGGKKLSPSAVYVQADAHRLPVSSESIDAILCFAAFAHFTGKDAFLREAHRVLHADGKVALCHPMSSAELNRFHRNVGDAVGNDVLPEAERVAAVARKTGFDVDKALEKTGLYMVALRKPPSTNAYSSAQ